MAILDTLNGQMAPWQQALLQKRQSLMQNGGMQQPVRVGGHSWLPQQQQQGGAMQALMGGMGEDMGGGQGGGFQDNFVNSLMNNINFPGNPGQLVANQAPMMNPSIPGLNPLQPNIPFKAPNSSLMSPAAPQMLNGPFKNSTGPSIETPSLPRAPSFGLPAGATMPLGLPRDPDVDAIAHAIGKVETGGQKNPYNTTVNAGKGRIAIGKYQVLNTNVPRWTEQVLGKKMSPIEFKNDPTAQEMVARAKFKEYYEKYGTPEDVAAMWFSGKPAKNNTRSEAGTGFSVPQYLQRFQSHLGNYLNKKVF